MSISMNRIHAIIDDRFVKDQNNDIVVNHLKFPAVENMPVWKQIKNQFPTEYKKLVDSIFDELHPF